MCQQTKKKYYNKLLSSHIFLFSILLFSCFFSCQKDKEEYFEICIKKIYISCQDSLCTQSHLVISLISHFEQDTIDVFMNSRRTRRGYTLFTLLDGDTVSIGFAGDILDFPPKWKEEDLPYMEYRLSYFSFRQTGTFLSDSILTRENVTKIINSPIYYYIEGQGQPKGSKPVKIVITRSDTLQILFQDHTQYKYGDNYPM